MKEREGSVERSKGSVLICKDLDKLCRALIYCRKVVFMCIWKRLGFFFILFSMGPRTLGWSEVTKCCPDLGEVISVGSFSALVCSLPRRGSNEYIARVSVWISVVILQQILQSKDLSRSKLSPSHMQTARSDGIEACVLVQEADFLVWGCAASAIVFVAWSNGSEGGVHTCSKQRCKKHWMSAKICTIYLEHRDSTFHTCVVCYQFSLKNPFKM